MKPCSTNRKHLTLLAAGALESNHEPSLRAHLDQCDGCRNYFIEISGITKKLRVSAEYDSEIESSEVFHQNLVRKLKEEKPASVWKAALDLLLRPRVMARVALPAMVAIVVILIVLRHPPMPSLPGPTIAARSTPVSKPNLDPTISNYESVANRSFEELDDLLTKQENRIPAETPLYTLSALARANAVD